MTPNVPRIDIQSPTYISDSLRAYRDRARASGFMQSAASGLSGSDIEGLARHFGRYISANLDQSTESDVAPELALTGRSSKYLETQLQLFARIPQVRDGGPLLA